MSETRSGASSSLQGGVEVVKWCSIVIARTHCSMDGGKGDVHNVIRARSSLHRGVEVDKVVFECGSTYTLLGGW